MEQLFHGASLLQPSMQASYLDAHCADEPALKAEVLELLGFNSSVNDLMATPGRA